jgi:hypothetical protein
VFAFDLSGTSFDLPATGTNATLILLGDDAKNIENAATPDD